MSSFAQRLVLFAGVAIGLLGGLIYAWGVEPVEYVDVGPWMMRPDYRQEWVRLAALSYVADGDLERARWRLADLDRQDIAVAMEALIDEYAAAGRSAETMRRLTVLAQALGVQTPAMLVYLETPVAPSVPTGTPPPTFEPTLEPPEPTITLTPEPTIKPTRTPYPPTVTPEPRPPFQLAAKEQICEQGQKPHIEVIVQDEEGGGVPGVEVWLMWDGGADRAVTGLKPEQGMGYADFDAESGVDYSLGISELGAPLASDLRLESCPEEKGKEPLVGSWRVVLGRRSPATSTTTVTPESEGGE
ncbi:MAG: hypothetical protein JXA14_18405 [Anaerolineae bacterium]|nr:hypothetical protein [Anaerolineae bacterium]